VLWVIIFIPWLLVIAPPPVKFYEIKIGKIEYNDSWFSYVKN